MPKPWRWARRLHALVGPLREVYQGTDPGIPIPSAKDLLQGSECRFTRAVPWRHASELPFVTQRSSQTGDLGFRSGDQVQPTDHEPHRDLLCGYGVQDLLDARVGASDQQA